MIVEQFLDFHCGHESRLVINTQGLNHRVSYTADAGFVPSFWN
jgi:hypothetical protein